MSCLVLSCPVLSCLVLSCLVSSSLVSTGIRYLTQFAGGAAFENPWGMVSVILLMSCVAVLLRLSSCGCVAVMSVLPCRVLYLFCYDIGRIRFYIFLPDITLYIFLPLYIFLSLSGRSVQMILRMGKKKTRCKGLESSFHEYKHKTKTRQSQRLLRRGETAKPRQG